MGTLDALGSGMLESGFNDGATLDERRRRITSVAALLDRDTDPNPRALMRQCHCHCHCLCLRQAWSSLVLSNRCLFGQP